MPSEDYERTVLLRSRRRSRGSAVLATCSGRGAHANDPLITNLFSPLIPQVLFVQRLDDPLVARVNHCSVDELLVQ